MRPELSTVEEGQSRISDPGLATLGYDLRKFRHFGLAALAVTFTIFIKFVSDWVLGEGPPLVLFVATVTIVSWHGGRAPGLFALTLSAIVCSLPFIYPSGWLAIRNPNFGFRLVIFALEGSLICHLMGLLHASRHRAAEGTSARRHAEESLRVTEERYRFLVEGVEDYAIFMLDLGGRIMSWNTGAERITGYHEDEAFGKHFSLLYTAEDIQRCHPDDELINALKHGRFEEEGWRVRKDGARFWANVVITPLYDENRKVRGFAKITRDITERKRGEELLTYQGTHDALTGLPNRVLLLRNVEEAIASGGRGGDGFCLLLLDLDRFKAINDTFGHHFGDAVLRGMRPLLLNLVRPSDTVARLEGDEFGILLDASDRAHATSIAERIVADLSRPIIVEGQPLEVSGSIGVAIYPEQGQDTMTLMKHAHESMHAAKRAQAGHAVYIPDQTGSTACRLAMVDELRQGIEHQQFVLHYQPKLDLRTMQVTSAEALVRWQHPREGLLLPGDFIPLAEQTGSIRPLGLWSLNAASRQCQAWHRGGMGLNLAVNLANGNFEDDSVLEAITTLLANSGSLPQWLTVEATETAMIADRGKAKWILTRLHELGVRISIDDFGTGHSSFSYLKDLPADEVKVDRTFVKDLAVCKTNATIVKAIIDVAHDLGLRVVAKGVENRAALDLLISWGCDLAQGYYISRPLPPAEFMRWLVKSGAQPLALSASKPASTSRNRPRSILCPQNEPMIVPS